MSTLIIDHYGLGLNKIKINLIHYLIDLENSIKSSNDLKSLVIMKFEGYSDREIGEFLGYTTGQVRTLKKKLYRKTI